MKKVGKTDGKTKAEEHLEGGRQRRPRGNQRVHMAEALCREGKFFRINEKPVMSKMEPVGVLKVSQLHDGLFIGH
jgi:hypothetical protein